MKHSYFEIRNFKGINNIRLDLTSQPRSNIFTLIGLNESGKTTILEALNFASYRIDKLDPLNLPGYSVKDVHELIPISKRANFNDSIEIIVGYELEIDDQVAIKDYLKRTFDLENCDDIKPFNITRRYEFRDSKVIDKATNYWSMEFQGSKKRSKKKIQLQGDDWQKATTYVMGLLPSVLYFPNFLFEFPDRIYLEDVAVDAKKT